MGYTHYYNIPDRTQDMKVSEIAQDISQLAEAAGIPLADGTGAQGTSPAIGPDVIWFNGVGDDAYETFRYPPDYSRGISPGFEFTKTARRPYDLVITAALVTIKHYMGDAVEVSSDGEFDTQDWAAAYALYSQVFPDRLLPLQFQV